MNKTLKRIVTIIILICFVGISLFSVVAPFLAYAAPSQSDVTNVQQKKDEQQKKINEANVAKNEVIVGTNELNNDDINVYIDKMKVILNKVAKLSAENNIKPVVLIHQRFWEDSNGNIITENKEAYINAFKKCCENNGIKVIDVTKPMIDCYKTNFNFSYGFSNTSPGEGHLNKTGHRIIAEEVYQRINEMEENK